MSPIKEKINMRYFLRHTKDAKKKIRKNQIVLIENSKDDMNFIIMTEPKFVQIFKKKDKPTLEQVDKFISSISDSWKRKKIDPVKWQKKIRSEWDRKII